MTELTARELQLMQVAFEVPRSYKDIDEWLSDDCGDGRHSIEQELLADIERHEKSELIALGESK